MSEWDSDRLAAAHVLNPEIADLQSTTNLGSEIPKSTMLYMRPIQRSRPSVSHGT